jgi:hypothetical protein
MGVKRIWWRNLWREISIVIKVTVSLKQRHFSFQQLQCTFYNPHCYVFTFKMSTQKIGKWHCHAYRRSFISSKLLSLFLFTMPEEIGMNIVDILEWHPKPSSPPIFQYLLQLETGGGGAKSSSLCQCGAFPPCPNLRNTAELSTN